MTLKEVYAVYALHNRQREKIVCSALGEEGRVISPQGRSNWRCEIKKKSGRRRVGEVDGSGMVRRGGICEFTQGEKWGNWSISPSWILNFYEQSEERRGKSKNGRLLFTITIPIFTIPGICVCHPHWCLTAPNSLALSQSKAKSFYCWLLRDSAVKPKETNRPEAWQTICNEDDKEIICIFFCSHFTIFCHYFGECF